MKRPNKSTVFALIGGLIGAGALVTVLIVAMKPSVGTGDARSDSQTAQPTATAVPSSGEPSSPEVPAPTALPEARYDAVIPALPAARADLEPMAAQIGALGADTAVSATPGGVPVAFLAGQNFLGEPTTVLVVSRRDDGWIEVLTPARASLPSADPAAPAQTAGWIRTESVREPVPVSVRVVISVGSQTLAIISRDGTTRSFPVGVGTDDTPTPVGVTGYLQARYLDPAQGQTEHRIQLTSLHSTAADEPFGGTDGGLIGIHYNRTNTGAVSHGCLRLDAEGISAVDALPLGTPVTIVE